MAWKNDVRERTREWARPIKTGVSLAEIPLWAKQAVACLFLFALLYGAASARAGLAVDVASFARGVVSQDISYEAVKTWVQSIPSRIGNLANLDIRDWWSAAVTGEPTQLAWPASGTVTSYFGWRPDPNSASMELHQGIDIDAALGSKVSSILAGVVTAVYQSPEYGLVVEVEHAGGLSSVYGHLDSASVVKDQRVSRGDAVGKVGQSGNATGPHLHFELRKDGLEVDPMTVLPPQVKGP